MSDNALLESCKELKAVCAAAMRVMTDLDTAYRLGIAAESLPERFVDELKLLGIENGFGARAEAAIRQAEDI